MIKTFQIGISILTLFIVSNIMAEENTKKDNISMFPKAKKGFERHIIKVPATDNDYNNRVELLIGKMMLVDCNQHSLAGKLENITLKGWGYKYIEVSDIREGISTMMACNKEKTEKFITLRTTKDKLRRYNSRLPIVIYLPEGYQVRYRVWSAGINTYTAEQR